MTQLSKERTSKTLLCSILVGRRLEAVPELNGDTTLKVVVESFHAKRPDILQSASSILLDFAQIVTKCFAPRLSNILKILAQYLL